jgi:hypothetical protein
MIDTTLVPFAYGFLVIAALAFAVAVPRNSRSATTMPVTATPALVTVAGPTERSYTRAA